MRSKFAHCLWLVLALALGRASAAEPLLWFDAGRPTSDARQALGLLLSAATEGLNPGDYGALALQERLMQASQGSVPTESVQGPLDTALTAALQHYLSDLQSGRVDPRQIHANFSVARHGRLDSIKLREAVAGHRLSEFVRQMAPPLPMYGSLQRALARYRDLATHPAWQAALAPLPGRKLVAGQAYAGLALLAQRLEVLGDLQPGTAAPLRLEGPLLNALQAFQERHGLTPDGVLGHDTLQQLNVTPAARLRQIELTMERLRWTPFLQVPRMIVVNVPEFVLRAYEVRDGQVDVKLTMKVIVGKALNTRTPLFDEDMRFIEFSPYWNVPPSIARKELVPRLRRDASHFEREGFEFVSGSGQAVRTLSVENLDAVLSGGWRIRQRPGPKNALGDIKFVFPNNDNIYLHHTPAPKLFERARRDFSHGCIRVEAPVALAQFVLHDEPAWTEERIRQAMEKGESNTWRLAQPLPVLIAYSTVLVKKERVFFYADLYGHDRLLDQALRQHSAAPSHVPAPNAVAR
jgi:murein L,D-transpeptidase YcbB/YkuD